MTEDNKSVNTEFQSEAAVRAFCRWVLRIPVPDDKLTEYATAKEKKAFVEKRNRRLKTQIDDICGITLKSANVQAIDAPYFKIVKAKYKNPLSSGGSAIANSRFNFKSNDELRNRTIYFGQDKICCYTELFHLDIQRDNYISTLLQASSVLSQTELEKSEFKKYKYCVYEYEVKVQNVLILTSQSTYKALGIPDRVVKDEWYSVNDDYEIPTAGQLLGTIAKKHGFNGILYTSVRNQTKSNLVLFEENTGELKFSSKSKVDLDTEKLFKDITQRNSGS